MNLWLVYYWLSKYYSLGGNNIQGTIPSEIELLSTSLVSLSIGKHFLTSRLTASQYSAYSVVIFTCSSQIWNLLCLRIKDQNQLSGSIPIQLGELEVLETLSLREYNKFSVNERFFDLAKTKHENLLCDSKLTNVFIFIFSFEYHIGLRWESIKWNNPI